MLPASKAAKFFPVDVQVSEGTHHVEVRRAGYQSFSSDVQVRRGETVPLNVSLLARNNNGQQTP